MLDWKNIHSESALQGLSQTPDGFLYPIISNLFSQSFLSIAKIGVLPGFLLVSSNVKQAYELSKISSVLTVLFSCSLYNLSASPILYEVNKDKKLTVYKKVVINPDDKIVV